MTFAYILGIVLAVVFLVFAIVCTQKESEIIGFYKTIGLFGRVKAFFTLDFLLAGFGGIIGGIVFLIMNAVSKKAPMSTEEAVSLLIGGVIALPIGLLLYMSIMKRCDPKSRAKVTKDLLIASFGLMFKFSFFYLNFIFKMWVYEPAHMYTLEDGRQVYIYGTDVYDLNMCLIGKYDSSYDKVILF